MQSPRARFTALAVVTAILAACGGATGGTPGSTAGATGGAVAVGGDLCGLLGPGDFGAAGVPGAGPLSENNNPPTDFYCSYTEASSAMGGIEFDAFTLSSADDPDGVFATMLDSTGLTGGPDRAGDVGADEATIATDVAGEGGFAGKVALIAVHKGKLVFDIGFPAGPDAERQLIDLAKLVIGRAAAQVG
jgi:hypothetical protein